MSPLIILKIHTLVYVVLSASQAFSANPTSCEAFKRWYYQSPSYQVCTAKGSTSFCSDGMTDMEALCLGGGGSFCSTASSYGEAICLAFGGSYCSTADNIAQGLCLAVNGSYCAHIDINDGDYENKKQEWLSQVLWQCRIVNERRL